MNGRRKHLILAIIPIILAVATISAFAQSTRRKGIKASEPQPVLTERVVQPLDTITDPAVISRMVRIEAFKKPAASRTESVLITNASTADTLHAVVADIDYRTLEGKQLNRRTVTFAVDVPPGETRHAGVESWDKQQLFYHYDTPPVRPTGRTTAFKITLTPVSIIVSKPAP